MRLVTSTKILFFVLLFIPAEQTFTQSTSQPQESPNFVSAEVSFQEFAHRLGPWEIKHPELATRVVTRSQEDVISRSLHPHESVNMEYRLTFPTLDIYSSAGESFYFSDSSDVNVKLIDALPRVIPEPDLDPRYKVRPSLSEALSMVPGIPRSDWATPAQFDYTIFAVIMDHKPVQSTDDSAGHAKKKTTQIQNMNEGGPAIEVIKAPPDTPDVAQRKALDKEANALANKAQDEALQRLKTRLNGSRVRVIEIHLTPQ